MGDTSGALNQFGEAAWPEYERRILSWRSRLSGDQAYGLAMSLRLLGPDGSAATDRARQEMITELAADIGSGRAPAREGPRYSVLAAAIGAIAPNQPERVVEVIGGLAASPQLAVRLLREVENKRCPPDVKEQIVRDLWALLKSKPGDDPLRTALTPVLSRMAPHVFAAEPGPIFSEEEALAAIRDCAYYIRDPISQSAKGLRRQREETADRVAEWLRKDATPQDQVRVRLALAWLNLLLERYDACLAFVDVPPDQLKEEREKVVVAAFRGRALAGLRKFDEAKASLDWAADHSTASAQYGGTLRQHHPPVDH